MTTEGMGIIRLDVENIQRISAVRIEPQGALVKVTGKNEAGKSSVLDSIEMALGGRAKLSKVPVRQGEEKGVIRLLVGVARVNPDGTPVKEGRKIIYDPKYLIKKTIRPSGADILKITTPDESATYEKQKQTLLNSFLTDFTFDPLVFAEADSKKQKEMVLRVSRIDLDFKKLSAISGIDIEEVEGVLDPNDYFKSIEDRLSSTRKLHNNELKRLSALIAKTKQDIPEGMEKTESVEVAELLERRKAQEKLGAVKTQAKIELLAKGRDYEDALRQVERGKEEYGSIQKRLKILQEQLEEKEKEIEANMRVVAEMEKEGKAARTAFEAMPDPVYDEIDKALEKADYTNQVAASVTTLMRLEEANLAEANLANDANEKLTAVRAYREEVYQGGRFPVDGLGFDDDGNLTFEGVPIEQRGGSRRIIIGCHVCASTNPLLRVILIRAGNEIDSDNIAALARWAEDHGFQIWIEQIATKPEGDAFYIEDGTTFNQGELFKKGEGDDADTDGTAS